MYDGRYNMYDGRYVVYDGRSIVYAGRFILCTTAGSSILCTKDAISSCIRAELLVILALEAREEKKYK